MLTVTGLPNNLAEYIDFSMIAQAEGLKFGIEHFRRRKPHCSGTLFWQLNDCWPVLSWSLIDYYGFGKAGYFYSRRVYAPVLASFKEEAEGGVSLWVTNDTLDNVRDTLTVRLGTFAGTTVWEQAVEINVPPNQSVEVIRWSAERLRPSADRYLWVISGKGLCPPNRHFFTPIKDLARTAVEPKVQIQSVSERELAVEVSAPEGYVYFFHLTHPNEFTAYEDNYFDLQPGESRTVRVWNPRVGIKADEIGVGWR